MAMMIFLGLQDDMQVLKLLPGHSGWYTKTLGPVLEEKGKLFLSIGTDSFSTMIADKPGSSTTEIIPFDSIAQYRQKNTAQLCRSSASVSASSIWCLPFGMYTTLMLLAGPA